MCVSRYIKNGQRLWGRRNGLVKSQLCRRLFRRSNAIRKRAAVQKSRAKLLFSEKPNESLTHAHVLNCFWLYHSQPSKILMDLFPTRFSHKRESRDCKYENGVSLFPSFQLCLQHFLYVLRKSRFSLHSSVLRLFMFGEASSHFAANWSVTNISKKEKRR